MNKQTKSHAKIIFKEFSKIRRNFLAPKSHLAQWRHQKDLQHLSLLYSDIKARFNSTAPPQRSIALKSAPQRHKGTIQLNSTTKMVYSAQGCSTAPEKAHTTQQCHHHSPVPSSRQIISYPFIKFHYCHVTTTNGHIPFQRLKISISISRTLEYDI